MMKKDRLLELADLLRHLPEKVPDLDGFNLDVFYDPAYGYARDPETGQELKDGFCGTTACALGAAALYPPFQALGLRLSKGYEPGNIFLEGCTDVYGDPLYDFDAGAEFFGLPHGVAEKLFYPLGNTYGRDAVFGGAGTGPKPAHVAEVIEFLAEKGRLPYRDEAEEIARAYDYAPDPCE